MKIAIAATFYFAIVFGVGFLLGPIRVLWLEPRIGPTLAVLCEMPFLVAAMVVAARWIPNRVALEKSVGMLAAMGLGALFLQQIADFTVAIAIRGVAPAEQLIYLGTPAGLIYVTSLVAFATMPVFANRF